MKSLVLKFIHDRHLLGLYLINFIHQKILRITSPKVPLLHFTNVISADTGFELVGEGELADRCLRINGGILIQAANGVLIDRSSLIGPGVKIISGNHHFNDFSLSSIPSSPIEIGKHCWIGANSVILPEVKLLERTIVGAGSVVTKSFGRSNILIAGNPAKIIRQLDI